MSDPGNRSWDEMVDRLRRAAAEVLAAAGSAGSPGTDDEATATRLKSDVARLERSASELRSKLSASIAERRTEIETSFDRERAERTTDQLKSSLDELAALAANLASGVAAAASSSLKQAEPELKTAARALEDVASSATAWVRSVVDPTREQPGAPSSQERPPLDDL
jgi:chromosome segregation ATPase